MTIHNRVRNTGLRPKGTVNVGRTVKNHCIGVNYWCCS